MTSILTWDGYSINDGTNYVSFFASPYRGNASVKGNTVPRHGRFPLVGGVSRLDKTMVIETLLEAADLVAARSALRTIFETESGEIKTLIIQGDDGTEQYIQAIAETHVEVDYAPVRFLTMIRIHDDPSYRSTELQTDTESVIATEQQWIITNAGDQIARPVITVTPTTTHSGINPYRRFVAVRWFGRAATRYPVDIMNNAWDTAALVTAVKMQADGDDIRVLVNGVFTGFWLDDINTADTSVWLPLNFADNVFEHLLVTAIASSGTVETIDVDQDISNYPSQGILLIDSEIFLYTEKNNALQRFTISARAAHGTSMAAHTATTVVHWIQHAIEVQYGNLSMTAYAPTDTEEPIITLASSTNLAWDYDSFGGIGLTGERGSPQRPGSWTKTGQYIFTNWIWTWYNQTQFPNYPAGNPDTNNPYTVMGLYQHQASNQAPRPQRWQLFCPCGLTAANFTNGSKRANFLNTYWRGYVRSADRSGQWLLDYSIPIPSTTAAWEAWSQNITSPQGNRYIALDLEAFYGGNSNTPAGFFVEVGDVLVTFDSTMCPTSYLAPERGNYTILAELIHVESGLSLEITYPTSLNNSLIINTDTGEITDESDGSNQFQAVRRLPRSRVEWLPLLPGVNTLQWNETGVAGVDVTFDWRERRGA